MTAAESEAIQKQIIAGAYAADPVGWDSDDWQQREKRLASFLCTARGQYLLSELQKLGVKFSWR